MTPLVAGDLHSYRDLPVNLYQVEWKYRDEFRPRYGLLRVREFLMKDAYSFDRDDEAMHVSYGTMMDAYRRIFDRCGIRYVVVEADPGTIGGGTNHEFMAEAEVGEDLYVACPNGDYLADIEAARPMAPEPFEPAELEPVTEVSTGRRDDRGRHRTARRFGRADAEVHLVPGRRHGGRRARARRPRDRPGEARAPVLPDAGAVRGRGLRVERLREGVRRPAGSRRGRRRPGRRGRSRRRRLDHRRERARPARDRREHAP